MENNEITGARLVSKPVTQEYAEGHDRIFGRKRTPMSTEYYPPRDMTECSCEKIQLELPIGDVYSQVDSDYKQDSCC